MWYKMIFIDICRKLKWAFVSVIILRTRCSGRFYARTFFLQFLELIEIFLFMSLIMANLFTKKFTLIFDDDITSCHSGKDHVEVIHKLEMTMEKSCRVKAQFCNLKPHPTQCHFFLSLYKSAANIKYRKRILNNNEIINEIMK